jgi:hypothetical protein
MLSAVFSNCPGASVSDSVPGEFRLYRESGCVETT